MQYYRHKQARASGENLNYVTLAPQTRPSDENLNYVTLLPQARQAWASGEILNYLLSHKSDIL